MRAVIGRAALLAPMLAAAHAAATPPALLFAGQTLHAAEPATAATADLWLDPDGRYTLFLDQPAARPRYRAQHGAFQVGTIAGGVSLCLRPDEAAPADTPFAAPGCTDLPVRPIGEVVRLQTGARADWLLLLLQGR